jgi:hypothetical protein
MTKTQDELLREFAMKYNHWYYNTETIDEKFLSDLSAAFEERLREELIKYDKFLSSTYWGISHVIKHDEAVDEYLKTREK